ncbi:MAG: hypothetical protein DRH08_02805 [Deltaproteobacteria bacterium]|nr:MAG: hypothetical protein DRH08_02805 [Deltaproteobacteria bacterium]
MFQIVEKEIQIRFPPREHLHVLTCQVPNNLERRNLIYNLAYPDRNWHTIQSILNLVVTGRGNLKKTNFLFFPESLLPFDHFQDAIDLIDLMRPNTVTVIGLGPINLGEYKGLLQRFAADNRETLDSVIEDLDSGDLETLPVNCCMIAVKEDDARLRVFFEAKSHPFVGEETLDSDHYLYRGKIFPLFRCQPSCFNFMTLICIDYAYRDLYQSNINVIIEKANQLFFETRQQLDLLAVIECNPKPEHHAFGDVANGFYGEYLARSPGVDDTVTLFCNGSDETVCSGSTGDARFGHSAVLIHKKHKLKPVEMEEYSTDDFGGRPICRLRFGAGTRLYYFSLPFFHKLDPRATRTPLKVHAVFRSEQEHWTRVSTNELAVETAKTFRLTSMQKANAL